MLIFEIKDGVLIKYHGYQTHVTIPDGVTRIAKKAFSNRKENIESLVIPESVTEIRLYKPTESYPCRRNTADRQECV